MSITKELVWTHVKETYNGDPTAATQYQLATFKILKLLRQACLAVNTMGGPNTDNGILLCTDGSGTAPAQDRLVFTGDDAADCLKLVSAASGTNHTWATWKFFGRYWCFDSIPNGALKNYYCQVHSDCDFNSDGSATTRPTPKTCSLASGRAWWFYGPTASQNTASSGVFWNGATGGASTAANLRFQYHLMYCSTAIRLFVNVGGYTSFVFLAERPVSASRVQPTCFYIHGSMSTGGATSGPASYDIFYNTGGNLTTSAAATGLALSPAGGTWDSYCKLQPDCAMATSGWYIGCQIEIIGGTQDGQVRIIDGYNVATNEIHVSVAFPGVLDATSYYSITKSIQPVHLFAPGAGVLSGSTGMLLTTPTALEQKWLVSPLAVNCYATYHSSVYDRIPDLYMGPSSMVNGQLYETIATPDWVQYGNFVVPNDGITACPVT